MRGDRVLLTTWERGVFWWDTGTGRTTTVTHRPAGRADLANDLLSTYTADPYLDGCTVLSRLSRPGRVLWRSCTERVDSVNTDGTRIATVHILSDGIGPRDITVRDVRGTRLARYRTAQWFGSIRWEDPRTVLLDTNATKHATVRCDLADCENATDPEPPLVIRTSASRTAPTR